MICGGMSRCFVVCCQDVFYLVVKIVCGGLSRCSVSGGQDVLWLVLKIFCCEYLFWWVVKIFCTLLTPYNYLVRQKYQYFIRGDPYKLGQKSLNQQIISKVKLHESF